MVHFGHRRAASVPVEPIRVFDGASTAQRISRAVLDDTDALMSASKRHDQELMHDINARLASNQTAPAPAVVVRRSSITSSRRPPLPPSSGRSSTAVVVSSSTTPSRRSRYYDDDDDDVTLPPMPVTRSVIRASSVPPPRLTTTNYSAATAPPPTRTSMHVTGGPPSSNNVGYWKTYLMDIENDTNRSGRCDQHPYLSDYIPTRVTNPPGLISPVADLAIRQAHRNLDRINKELKYPTPNGPTASGDGGVNPYATPLYHYYGPSTSPSVTSAYELPYELTRQSNYYQLPSCWSRTSSPAVPVTVRRASLSPLRGSGGSGYHRLPRDLSRERFNPIVLPSEHVVVSAQSPLPPLPSVGRYRAASSDRPTSSKYDRTSYQLPMSALFIVAGAKTPKTADVDSSSRRAYHDGPTATIPQTSGSARPISEARQRVRNVLCKVKNNPHYFG